MQMPTIDTLEEKVQQAFCVMLHCYAAQMTGYKVHCYFNSSFYAEAQRHGCMLTNILRLQPSEMMPYTKVGLFQSLKDYVQVLSELPKDIMCPREIVPIQFLLDQATIWMKTAEWHGIE